jgi:hypothetical protein
VIGHYTEERVDLQQGRCLHELNVCVMVKQSSPYRRLNLPSSSVSKTGAISDSCRSRTFNFDWATILLQCSLIFPLHHLQRALILLQTHQSTHVVPEISSFASLFYFTFLSCPNCLLSFLNSDQFCRCNDMLSFITRLLLFN